MSWVKSMHLGSPSDPSQAAAAETKLRYVYSILKPPGHSSRSWSDRCWARRSRATYTQFQNHMVRVIETHIVAPNSIPLPLHVVLELSIRSSASPSVAAVWLGLWNSGHVVLKSSIRSSALPGVAAVWLGFWNSDQVVLKSSIPSLASPCSAAVWLGFWKSDHVVLKSNICISALPWCQRSDWGLRVTKNAYFSLIPPTKQLLLVTFCDPTARIVKRNGIDKRQRTDVVRTDRR